MPTSVLKKQDYLARITLKSSDDQCVHNRRLCDKYVQFFIISVVLTKRPDLAPSASVEFTPTSSACRIDAPFKSMPETDWSPYKLYPLQLFLRIRLSMNNLPSL